MTSQVIIAGVERPYCYGLGALMIAERITGKSWAGISTITDTYVLHYACLLNADRDTDLTFEALLAAVDDEPALGKRLTDTLTTQLARWGVLADTATEDGGKKAGKKKS